MLKYETAKVLRGVGFPEPIRSEYYPGEFKCGCNESAGVQGGERKEVLSCGRQYMYYPTLSELIEACGQRFDSLTREREGHWTAQAEDFGQDGFFYLVESPTAEEAVAKLYIELNKV